MNEHFIQSIKNNYPLQIIYTISMIKHLISNFNMNVRFFILILYTDHLNLYRLRVVSQILLLFPDRTLTNKD